MPAGAVAEDAVPGILLEIRLGIFARPQIAEKLALAGGQDEVPHIIMVVGLRIVTRLCGKGIQGRFFDIPGRISQIVRRVRLAFLSGKGRVKPQKRAELKGPPRPERYVGDCDGPVIPEAGGQNLYVLRIGVLEKMGQAQNVPVADCAVREAGRNIIPEIGFMLERGDPADAVIPKQIHFSASEFLQHAGVGDKETKAVIPVTHALPADAVRLEALEEMLQIFLEPGNLGIRQIGPDVEKRGGHAAGTDRAPVAGRGFPPKAPVQERSNDPPLNFRADSAAEQGLQTVAQKLPDLAEGKARFRGKQVDEGAVVPGFIGDVGGSAQVYSSQTAQITSPSSVRYLGSSG